MEIDAEENKYYKLEKKDIYNILITTEKFEVIIN